MPKCGSTQIHADQRGFTIWTGDIGAGKIVITCLKCAYKFKPGQRREGGLFGLFAMLFGR